MTARQWTLLLLLVASVFLNYIDRSNLSLAGPMMQKEFSFSARQMAWLFGAFFWTYALMQLFGVAGWLTDRFPAGLVLAGGLVVWSAATILTGVLSGTAPLFAARLLVGGGESIAYPCYSRIFASDIPEGHRGLGNALIDAGAKFGPAVGTLFGGLLLERVGWRWFFVVLGFATVLWVVPWIWVAPRGKSAERAPAGQPGTLEILESRSAWGAFFGHFCGNYFWYFLLTWLPTYLVNDRGFPMARVVSITSLALLTIGSTTILTGWISDAWIRAGASVTRARKTMSVGGLACATVVLPVAMVHNEKLSLALLLASCLAFGTYASNHWAITQTLAGPLAAGRWSSLQNGVGNLSGIVGAWLTGLIVDRTHSFGLAFAVAGLIALTGAFLWGVVVGPVKEVEWRSATARALPSSPVSR